MNGLRTWIEIDVRALRHNVAEFRKLIGPKVSLMAVVKSNAYGHGLVPVAKALLALRSFRGGGWFGVDSIVEALRLRREGIKNPILVLGYTLPERYHAAAAHGIALTISHFDGLAALDRKNPRPAFHLKLDTGMHRQGFQEHEVPEVSRILGVRRLAPEGVYSHLAAAEDSRASRSQYAAFRRCLIELAGAGIRPRLTHLAATGGTLLRRAPGLNLVRIGLGLYGYLPSPQSAKRKVSCGR